MISDLDMAARHVSNSHYSLKFDYLLRSKSASE